MEPSAASRRTTNDLSKLLAAGAAAARHHDLAVGRACIGERLELVRVDGQPMRGSMLPSASGPAAMPEARRSQCKRPYQHCQL